MRSRRSRYGGYRGRKTGRDILKYIVVALAVLVAVLAAILFMGRDQLRQPEEENRQEQTQQPQEPVRPEAKPVPKPEPEPEPEPEVEAEAEAMAALGVEISQVLDGSWIQYLEANGGNAVVLNMKPDDGILKWDFEISGEESDINTQLKRMNSTEIYCVARMSCFRDEELANVYEYCIHSNSGYRWKDFGGVHWVSPAHPEVQDRLVAQAVELAELGFDEILLDNCGYPQDGSGEMGWIKRSDVYDLEELDVVMSAFLTKLHQAVEPYGTVISIRTNAAVVADANAAKTGLTGAVLEEYADRVWLSEVESDAPLAEILMQAGVSDVENRLVIQCAELLPEGSWEQAVLNF